MIDDESLKNIERLHQLKSEGVISEAEFEQSKQKILFGERRPRPNAHIGPWLADDDPFAWIVMPIKRWSDFEGRSCRKEFWMFQLLYLGLLVITAILLFVGGTDEDGVPTSFADVTLALDLVALTALLVPFIAVEVRRFHDQNRPGLFVLLNLIPYVGVIIVAVCMLIEGTPGPNRYGPRPGSENP